MEIMVYYIQWEIVSNDSNLNGKERKNERTNEQVIFIFQYCSLNATIKVKPLTCDVSFCSALTWENKSFNYYFLMIIQLIKTMIL